VPAGGVNAEEIAMHRTILVAFAAAGLVLATAPANRAMAITAAAPSELAPASPDANGIYMAHFTCDPDARGDGRRGNIGSGMKGRSGTTRRQCCSRIFGEARSLISCPPINGRMSGTRHGCGIGTRIILTDTARNRYGETNA
jgi:hypothetical protein